MKIQKTIKGLKSCFIEEKCEKCPYNLKFNQYECFNKLLDDIEKHLKNYKNILDNKKIENDYRTSN